MLNYISHTQFNQSVIVSKDTCLWKFSWCMNTAYFAYHIVSGMEIFALRRC